MNSTADSIELRHADTTVTIAPNRGAIVSSWRIVDRELLYMDAATFDDPAKNVRGGVPVLFPSPGKLENDRWHYVGVSGEMKQHGFARTLPWQIEARAMDSVTLVLASSDATSKAYPFLFDVRLTYSVRAHGLRIDCVITNHDLMPMPFALGFHPYFIANDKAQASIATPATRAFDNVRKITTAFAGFAFTRGEVDLHLMDHGSASASLVLEDLTIALNCSPPFSRWVIWSLPDKPFICLEPWTAAGNALNTGEGLMLLAPGQSQQLFVEMTARSSRAA